MLGSSLDRPDDDIRPDPRRSPEVAGALQRSYTLLRQRQFQAAVDAIEPFRSATMSDAQSMRVNYVLGTAAARLRNVRTAIGFLDEALDAAERLDDLSACAALAYLDAPLHYEMASVKSAAEYYQLALDALDALNPRVTDHQSADATLELDILVALAAQYFLLDRHSEAAALLERARLVGTPSPSNRKRRTDIEWMSALIERWRLRPYDALRHAQLALGEYRSFGALNELARIEIVVAEIELDLAANLPFSSPAHGESTLLPHTRIHAASALTHARAAGDRPAESMALLTVARYDRIAYPDGDVRPTINRALTIATELRDASVLGQVYAAMGDEMSSHGYFGPAVGLYRTALERFSSQEMSTLALWAERAMRRAEEMSAGEWPPKR